MESANEFTGGLAFIFIGTLIISLFAINKKVGFLLTWFIGFGTGLIISFIAGTNIGLLIAAFLTIIIVATSKRKNAIIESNQNKKQNSIADEIGKLNLLKEKGVINEAEFEQQKEKLLNG